MNIGKWNKLLKGIITLFHDIGIEREVDTLKGYNYKIF